MHKTNPEVKTKHQNEEEWSVVVIGVRRAVLRISEIDDLLGFSNTTAVPWAKIVLLMPETETESRWTTQAKDHTI